MKKRIQTAVLLALIAGCLAFLYPHLRVLSPWPRDYVTRLRWFQGYTDFNCAGLVMNAHGNARLASIGALMDPMYLQNGADGQLRIVADLPDRQSIRESQLRPGDVVTFLGGGHVTVYLGNGVWEDGDFRVGRENVATWRMASKANDNWFLGPVRVLRWKD
jgi:hypothetical protein